MGHQRPIGFPAEQTPVKRRNDEQAPIRKPASAHRHRRDLGDDLARALEIDGSNLIRAHVGEPESAIVPTWRLVEYQTARQGLQFRH